MTHTDYTKKILNIEDPNIYFYDDCLEIKKIKGVNTKVFHGFLLILLNIVLTVVVLMKVLMTLLNGTLKEIVKLKLLKLLTITLFFF